jgi:tetratricopeptide (TPR) repeat protein/transcriptional regulator with XRE-family HTH domain
MPHKPGSKAYRDRQRERLAGLGVGRRQAIEQLVADLMRRGYRPREAWRLACELTQEEVAARFNQIKGDPKVRMRGSRICEYEKWPIGGIRPPVRALKILAAVYETSWDRLVDIDDLDAMPVHDQEAFLDLGELRYGDHLDLLLPRQRTHLPSALRAGDDPQVSQSVTAKELATVPARGPLSERSGGGLLGEVTHFTGRDGPMAELRARIAEQTLEGAVVTIYAIDGMAGVGKTAFARHAAQELAKSFPDGAIWVDLYGHTPGMAPRQPSGALEQMLLQLGLPPEAIKADPVERRDQWRHYIHGQRLLIVLDNVLTSDQVLPLLPEAPGCLVLITSRRKLTGLTDAYPLSLDVLEWDEAERLFIKLVGQHRCEDRDALRQVLAACGRLPLAIRLIAGRLRHHRDELLTDVAADLVDQTAALDALEAEHLSIRAAFEWSYRPLTDAQRRAFRLLGWHPGPAITPVVITAVADVPPAQGRRLLRELVDHNLLEQLSLSGVPGGPRYRMHDLVRLYARERADAEESPTERAAAINRLAGSYLAITREADRLLRPYVTNGADKGTASGAMLAFADASQARSWLTVERLNLLGCIREMSSTSQAADLATVLAVHFCDSGFWSDVRYLYGQALTAHQHTGDERGEVDALWGLGQVERLVGEYRQARTHYAQALTLARKLGHRRGEADALWGLGEVERQVGEYDQAREYHTQALALARQLGYRRAEVDALWGLAQVERLVAAYAQAREYHTQALTLARQLGYRFGEADALWGLGQVERLVGEYSRARDYYTQALVLARQLGYRQAEAEALRGLGQVERCVGEYGLARDYYTETLALVRQLNYPRAEADTLRGLAQIERLVGENSRAREYDTQALVLARQLGYRRIEADALRGLGEDERLIGEYSVAREYHTQALVLARKLGYRRVESDALRGLGHVERSVGEYGLARDYHTQALTLAQQLSYRFGEASALRGLGQAQHLLGEYGLAREYHTQALTVARQLGDRRVEVDALRGLGQVERLIGEQGLAREYHTEVLTLARQLGYRRVEADALRELGDVEHSVGEYGLAREYHTQALTLARQLGDRRGEAEALCGLGYIAADTAKRDQACEIWRKALEIYQELAVPFAETIRTAMCQLDC